MKRKTSYDLCMSYIRFLYFSTWYHHQDRALTFLSSSSLFSLRLTICKRYLFLSRFLFCSQCQILRLLSLHLLQRTKKKKYPSVKTEWIFLWIYRTQSQLILLTLLIIFFQQKRMSMRSDYFFPCSAQSFLSLLHRGIPGKKCGTIVLSAEELSNCRVSKP